MAQGIRRRTWRLVGTGVAVGALVVSWPTGPSASAGTASFGPRTLSAAVGNTFGGLSAQGQSLFVDMNGTRRKVVRSALTLELTCTSGDEFWFKDKYFDLPVSRRGSFRTSFGPVTERNADGTTSDYQGRIAGQLNDTKTKLTGVWRITVTDHDATGALTDTCDSGAVSWKAKN